MMNDCENVEIREVLPELMLGTLPEAERVRVQQHLDACDDCSAELAIIRAVHASAAVPVVNVERIVAAIPPYRRKRAGMRRVYLELAAACLIGAVGISTFALHNSRSGATPATITTAGAASQGLALVNTSDLSDDGLAELTRDLDNLQAMPTVDPESVTPAALEEAPEPTSAGDSA
jgi:anti-sigma factor RsiW